MIQKPERGGQRVRFCTVSKELDNLEHDGKKIFTMHKDVFTRDINQIRFEYKVDASIKLGLINSSLGDELKYSAYTDVEGCEEDQEQA